MSARTGKLPGQKVTDRVRRQGLEPRTRGLRVRCSAYVYCRIMSGGAVLSATPPISLSSDIGHCYMVPRQPSKHGANTFTAARVTGRYVA
jgi:hypothetical protein